jgi:hypothetical protein
VTRYVRRALLAGLLLGLAAGTAIAVASRPSSRPEAPAAAAGQAPAAPPGRLGPALAPRDVRLEARIRDPGGEADWALRTFRTTSGGATLHCLQLGRVDDLGRFGWIAPGAAFRPVGFRFGEAPGTCDSARFLRRVGAQVSQAVLISDPRVALPRAARTVTFGLAAPGARGIAVDGADVPVSESGAFLRVERGGTSPRAPAAAVVLADGTVRRAPQPRPPIAPRTSRAAPGTARLAVRAPDPAGGAPWGVLAARSLEGRTCVGSPGRAVGEAVGHVDPWLGLFLGDAGLSTPLCPRAARVPTRARPAALSTLGSSLADEDPRGRIERRVAGGRTVLHGPVHRDVVSVTIRTPRDVRTLVPAQPYRVVLAVYDGRLDSGPLTVTSRMRDGREVTQRLERG